MVCIYFLLFFLLFIFIINVSEEESLTLYCTIEIYVTWLYQSIAFVLVFISFTAPFSYF